VRGFVVCSDRSCQLLVEFRLKLLAATGTAARKGGTQKLGLRAVIGRGRNCGKKADELLAIDGQVCLRFTFCSGAAVLPRHLWLMLPSSAPRERGKFEWP
jgi:hypothetical protein